MSEDLTVAVDLGGTHVRAALVDVGGAVHGRIRRETPHHEDTPSFLIEMIAEIADGRDVVRAVIGVPGVVDYDEERLVEAPNLPTRWCPMLSDQWLTEHSLAEGRELDIALANDADLAAVGESSFGAGVEARDVVYVTVSTGVGAGIVLGQRLMRGRYSGGEVGHSIIDRNRVVAGEDGTVEFLGSGTAIGRMAAAAGLDATGADLAALVVEGDPTVTEIWNEAIDAVALGVVNLCWMVTPQMVVIGGGVGMNSELVLPRVAKRVEELGPAIEPISIVAAKLGDDVGLIGAAAWWKAIGRER